MIMKMVFRQINNVNVEKIKKALLITYKLIQCTGPYS